MEKNNKTVPIFQTIALRNMKTKENKEGTLQDLFKCIDSLDQSRVSLFDYTSSIADGGQRSSLEKCLSGIKKIEEHLLVMARNKISTNGVTPENTDGMV